MKVIITAHLLSRFVFCTCCNDVIAFRRLCKGGWQGDGDVCMTAEMEGLEANEWVTFYFREREGGIKGRNRVWILPCRGFGGIDRKVTIDLGRCHAQPFFVWVGG